MLFVKHGRKDTANYLKYQIYVRIYGIKGGDYCKRFSFSPAFGRETAPVTSVY